MEKLVSDLIVDSWLRLCSAKGDEQKFDRAHRRHLHAIRTMTSLRRKAPSITINVLAAHPVRPALVRMMDGQDHWSGTPTALGQTLGRIASDVPRSPQALSGLLRKLAPVIRDQDKLALSFGGMGRDRGKTRRISVEKITAGR